MHGKHSIIGYRGPSRQRGAAAVFAGIAMVALLAAVTLTLDMGRLYLAKQTLQKQANLAALDASRSVARCLDEGIPAIGAIQTAVAESLARNGMTDLSSLQTPELGIVRRNPTTGLRSFEASTAQDADTVRVTLQQDLPKPLMPRPGSNGEDKLRVSATARQAAVGSFFLGSSVASVDPALVNQLLGGLLCDAGDASCAADIIALNIADASSGLLNVGISTGELAIALGVSVADLANPLSLSTMTPALDDVIDGLADAVSGTASGAVVSLLEDIAGLANSRAIAMDALFDDFSDAAPDTSIVNLFDLLVALGQASQADASGSNTIALPVNLDIPGIASVHAFINVLESPRFSGMGRPGEARAETAQIGIQLRIDGNGLLTGLTGTLTGLVNGLISGLLGVLTGITTDVDVASDLRIGIDVDAGIATATLERLQCPRSTVNNGLPIAEVSATPSTAAVRIGTFSGSAASAPSLTLPEQSAWSLARVQIDATCVLRILGICTLGNLGSADIDIALALSRLGVAGAPNPIPLDPFVDFDEVSSGSHGLPQQWLAHGSPENTVHPTSADNPQTASVPTSVSLDLALTVEDNGSGLVGALSGLLANLTSSVTGLVTPLLGLVNNLVGTLIDPLLATLGVRTGTAEVTMHAVSIGHPRLVTTELPAAESE